MSRPALNPPCTGWKEDLPPPCDAPLSEPHLGNQTPNYQDDICLEIPRSAMAYRGLVSALTLVLVISTLIDLPWMIIHTDPTDLESILMLVIPHVLITWCVVVLFRVDLAPHETCPLDSTGPVIKSTPTTSSINGGTHSTRAKSYRSVTTGPKSAPSAGPRPAHCQTVG